MGLIKVGDFFAFGGAWRLSSEKFMSSISYLDDLKLKLSWGKNGNQGLILMEHCRLLTMVLLVVFAMSLGAAILSMD